MTNPAPIRLASPDGASATIYPQGGHLAQWTPAGATSDRLFLSPSAVFAEGVPLRGGVPIIFPQFADLGALKKHGFARTRVWALEHLSTEGGEAKLRFSSNSETRVDWEHDFLLDLSIRIGGPSLTVQLSVHNTGPTPLSFTAALHTYLAVQEIEQVEVLGLSGLHYSDTADSKRMKQDSNAALRIAGEVDRNYFRTPPELLLLDGAKQLRIGQQGFTDTVIWNPGAAGSTSFKDLGPDDYRRFLCVEAAAIENPVVLAPSAIWTGHQSLTCI